MCCSADIFLGVIAILFPPLPVWVKRGICSADSIINILLCVLGFVPGLIHSWYIIAKFPEPPYEYETVPSDNGEGGRVTYVYVQNHPGHGPGHGGRQQQQQKQPKPQDNRAMNYGTAQNGGSSSGGEGGVPPSYASVVAGDNKVQSHE
jgi:uncharacterized membrane protein YqaE (UPF0057 family)